VPGTPHVRQQHLTASSVVTHGVQSWYFLSLTPDRERLQGGLHLVGKAAAVSSSLP